MVEQVIMVSKMHCSKRHIETQQHPRAYGRKNKKNEKKRIVLEIHFVGKNSLYATITFYYVTIIM